MIDVVATAAFRYIIIRLEGPKYVADESAKKGNQNERNFTYS